MGLYFKNIPVNPFENPSFLLQATYVRYTCHFHEDQYPHSFFLKQKNKGKGENKRQISPHFHLTNLQNLR
jgi:hypothetical protein